jgi:hypothetical protein
VAPEEVIAPRVPAKARRNHVDSRCFIECPGIARPVAANDLGAPRCPRLVELAGLSATCGP